MRAPSRISRYASILLAASLATCGGGETTGPDTTPHVGSIVISGRTGVRVGETVAFAAKVLDTGGKELTGHAVTWSSSDTAIARVSSSGSADAIAPGNAIITAATGAIKATAAFSILARAVTRIDVSPSLDSLFTGDSLALAVVLRDSTNAPLAAQPLVWRSSDTSKAVVSAAGMVRARAPGGFAVTASLTTLTGGAFLVSQLRPVSISLPDSVVVRLSQPVQVLPDVRSAGGIYLAGRATTWSIANTAVATIDAAGVIQPKVVGRTTLIGTCCGGARDTMDVVVRDIPVAHVLILATPGSTNVDVDSVIALSASLQGGLAPASHALQWISRDTTIMRVTPSASDSRNVTIRGLTAGGAWLVASTDGVSDSALITVMRSIARLAIEPDTMIMRVGGTATVHPTLQDAAGVVRVEPYPLAWSVADTSIAVMSNSNSPAYAIGRSAGTTTATGSLDYRGVHYVTTITLVVTGTGASRLTWSVPSKAVAVHDTAVIAVAVTDSSGAPLPGGQDVQIRIADTSIATVSPAFIGSLSGSANVRLRGLKDGATTLTATTSSGTATLWIRTILIPPVNLTIGAHPAIVQVGDTLPLTVTTVDGAGNVRSSANWSSSNPSVASVSSTGRLLAVAPGRTRITASLAARSDTATITVRTAAGPTISATSPTLLVAGSTITLTGTGFDADPALDVVTIDGVTATVIAATPTQLQVQAAPGTAYACAPTHSATITVATPTGTGALSVSFSPAAQHALAVGEARVVNGPDAVRCNELSVTGGTYLVQLVNLSFDPDATVAFRVRNLGSSVNATAPQRRAARLADGLPEPASRRPHLRVLEQNRALFRRAGPPAPLLREQRRPMASIADSVGARVRFRIPRVDRPDFCDSYDGVTARRAWIGAHLEIWEDATLSFGGLTDTVYARLGEEFESTMYAKVLANFGDPLALDAMLDRNGRIVLLVSPKVNSLGTAFVTGCDYYPESVAPSSNTGEIIYAFAPNLNTSAFMTGSPSWWLWQMRTVLMHEAKHIASYVQRLTRGAPPEETWLEEGTAVIAEEIWSRGIYGTTWKGNADYAHSVTCDPRPTSTACAGKPLSMLNAFASLYDYLDANAAPPGNERHTPLGPTDASDGSFYGSAWSLVRWTIDQYAASESAFLRTMTQDPVNIGIANLELRAGRAYADLVSDWLVATLYDDTAPVQPALFSHPSWHLRDIFSGMNRDFPGSFPTVFPFHARQVSFGATTIPVLELHGGTATVVRFDGTQTQKQLVDVSSPDGSLPPAGLRMRIVRIQ